MTGILVILGIVSVSAMLHRYFGSNVPGEFSCGSDEVCYCDKAPDCIKKNGK